MINTNCLPLTLQNMDMEVLDGEISVNIMPVHGEPMAFSTCIVSSGCVIMYIGYASDKLMSVDDIPTLLSSISILKLGQNTTITINANHPGEQNVEIELKGDNFTIMQRNGGILGVVKLMCSYSKNKEQIDILLNHLYDKHAYLYRNYLERTGNSSQIKINTNE